MLRLQMPCYGAFQQTALHAPRWWTPIDLVPSRDELRSGKIGQTADLLLDFGNTGHVTGSRQPLAADLALGGAAVRLHEHRDLAKAFAPVMNSGRLTIEDAAGGRREAPLALATHDIAETVRGSRLVHLVVPVFAQERYFEALLPLLEPDQTLIIWPGRFGSLLCEAMRRAYDTATAFGIVEVNTIPYGARRIEPTVVRVTFHAIALYAAATSGRTDGWADELLEQFPVLRTVASPIEAALRNSALPVLGIGPLLNVGAIENGGAGFSLFRDGMTASVRRAIWLAHEEMVAVARGQGLDIEPYDDAVYQSPASIEGANFRDQAGGIDGFKLLTGPDRVNHRYTIENIRYGLAVVVALGRQCGVATPFLDAICALADKTCGDDFARQGWRLSDLAIPAEIRAAD